MRKFLVLLLVLLLCAFGASAEGLQTEGEFDYLVQDLAWMDTKSVLIVGYHLPEGQDYVFIPQELDGYPVTSADLQGLPESVETVYAYQPYAAVLPPVGRELTEIIYVDYAMVQANTDYKAKLPDMAEGDIALAEAARIRRGEDNMPVQSALPAAEVANLDFPQELGGHRVHHNMLTNVSTEPGMTFASRPGGRAEIVDIRLAEGQNYVFIPVYWNGMVVYVEGETIPEQVEVVYTPWGSGFINPAEGRTLTEVFYVSDEEAKQYSDVEDLQPGDIALMRIRRFRTENGELVEEGSSYAADHRIKPGIPYLKAEDLPQELDGHRVNATALGRGAIARLAGECWTHDGYGFPSVVDAQLPEDANELVVPTDFVGQGMAQVWLDNMDDDLRTFYRPYGLYVCLSTNAGLPMGITYCNMLYADYAMVQADPALRQAFPDMDEDDYVLVECLVEMACDNQGNTLLGGVIFDPATLPTELRGHKLLLHPTLQEGAGGVDYQSLCRGELDAAFAAWLGVPAEEEVLTADNSAGESDGTVYTYGELLYTKNDAQQTANIVGYDLAEGQTELFIPTAIEGYTVVEFEYELVPLQIEKLWVNRNTGITIWNFGDKPTNHERLTYNYTQTEEDSITLDHVILDTWDGEGRLNGEQQFTNVNSVPETIAGKQVQFAQNGWFCHSEGIWDYALNQDGDGNVSVMIVGCTAPEGTKEVIVPPEIGGYTADVVIELDFLPESVERVYVLGDASVFSIICNEPRDREVTQVTYMETENKELKWVRAVTEDFATGTTRQWYESAVAIESLPKEIAGRKVLPPDASYEFLYTDGVWGYIVTEKDEKKVSTIVKYMGEDEPAFFSVPSVLGGCKVSAILFTALPESVKMVFVPGNETSVIDYAEQNGEVLVGSYEDVNDNEVKLGLVGRMIFMEGGGIHGGWVKMYVKDLPQEINGKKVRVPYGDYFLYTSGEWEYYLIYSESKKETLAVICGSNFHQGIEEVVVPAELDGYTVDGVEVAAIPQSVQTVYVPVDCSVSMGQTKRPNLKIVEAKE